MNGYACHCISMHGLTVNLWLKWSMSLCSCMHSYAGTPIEEPIGIGRSALRPPCYKPWGKRLHDSTASEFQPSDRDWPCLQGEGSFFIVSWQKRQSSLEFFGFLHGRITLFGIFLVHLFRVIRSNHHYHYMGNFALDPPPGSFFSES